MEQMVLLWQLQTRYHISWDFSVRSLLEEEEVHCLPRSRPRAPFSEAPYAWNSSFHPPETF